MRHEVKMPQLGMTQDSGVIVSWLKVPGDAVSKGDALFEVETDKATMEVEAQTGGFLAGVQAREGDDVPVGDTIAVIVESEAEVESHASAALTADAEEPEAEHSPEPTAESPKGEEDPATAGPVRSEAPAPLSMSPAHGKILASPKAKRLAMERGIDLAALRAQGVAEPIHANDLSRATSGGQSALTALAHGAALDALLDRSETADRTVLFSSFAAGAWRTLFQAEQVGIALRGLDGATSVIANPDRGGGAGDVAVLTLVDLCGTRLSGYAPSGGGVTLSLARQGDAYALALSFSEGALPFPHAAALLNDIAARVEDPIRQLV